MSNFYYRPIGDKICTVNQWARKISAQNANLLSISNVETYLQIFDSKRDSIRLKDI